jgi:predicted  nucleic acid-binding Zn-ribbon protein
MDANELAVLEEKIQAMLALIKKLRSEKEKLAEENKELQKQNESLEKQVKEQSKTQEKVLAKFEDEYNGLVAERKEVKSRIESLLNALDKFSLENE